MKQIIKRILREQIQSPDYLEKVSRILLQSEPPYFKMMKDHYGVTDLKDQYEVLHYIYGNDIRIYFGFNTIYISRGNNDRNKIYQEESDGYWTKWEYDSDGFMIYFEDIYKWWKSEYDENGNETYYENSDGTIRDKRNITESKVIKEQRLSYNEKVSKILEPPYIHNMEEQFGVTDHNDQLEILKYIYGNDIRINHTSIFNSNFNEIYFETSNGYWIKREFNSRGDQTYNEDINGEWKKFEYDSKGNNIFYEDNDGYWCKYEYDSNGYLKYSENSDGLWSKYEFDSNGNETYSENSNGKWFKREYDSRGNRTYIENNNGYWEKREYDSNDNCIYSENSRGVIEDYR
jgi:hypothetical protein